MAANTNPIFTGVPNVSVDGSGGTTMGPTLTTAANDYTGASANNQLVFTAGADGSYVKKLRFKAIGTNVVTVARIYINNGGANTSAANNTFIGEVQLPATTASATAPTQDIDFSINEAIDPNFKIFVGLATGVAAGWRVTAFGGKY